MTSRITHLRTMQSDKLNSNTLLLFYPKSSSCIRLINEYFMCQITKACRRFFIFVFIRGVLKAEAKMLTERSCKPMIPFRPCLDDEIQGYYHRVLFPPNIECVDIKYIVHDYAFNNFTSRYENGRRRP
jgi:hypothetical protein